MMGGPFRKVLWAILGIPAALVLLWGVLIVLSPFVANFSPMTGLALAISPLVVAGWLGGCATMTAFQTPLPKSPWVVEERWKHCSFHDYRPFEIVAINAKAHKQIRIAVVDVPGHYGPGLGLDDRGQVVVVVPKDTKIGDRHDEVAGVKVIYKPYDAHDDPLREGWKAWTADPGNPTLAEWYRQQPDFPAPGPAAAK